MNGIWPVAISSGRVPRKSNEKLDFTYIKDLIDGIIKVIENPNLTAPYFIEKLNRIIRYFRVLINSFDIMIKGMEREQFLKFRMALLPASGFQSAQFRMIEFYSTPVENLVDHKIRKNFSLNNSIEELFENIYWKKGGIDLKTGEKTLTLKQFEKRYRQKKSEKFKVFLDL